MRAKIIVPVAVLAIAILGLAFYYRFAFRSPSPKSSQAFAAQPAIVAQTAAPPHYDLAVATRQPDLPPAAPTSVDTYGTNPVDARISQLSDLGTSNDPVSLRSICSDLNNPDPQIRQAALDATVQFGSPDAIPDLRSALQAADDPHEKAAIQDAIDALQLPSATSN